MKNLAQKILNALKHTKNLDEVQTDIEKYQKNLSKNLTSPLLDSENKNKLLKVCMNLQNLAKSLYRYNVLVKNNKMTAAEEEKGEIESMLIKCGLSFNVKYVWRSELGENTCDECESMDGEEFESDEDIPPKPHPNCKCEVVIVDDDEDASSEYDDDEDEDSPTNDDDDVPSSRDDNKQPQQSKEEPCDVIYEIEDIINILEGNKSDIEIINDNFENEIQFLEDDIKTLENNIENIEKILNERQEEYGKHLPECPYNIDKEYDTVYEKLVWLENLRRDILGILSPATTIAKTLKIFISNYFELLYHAYVLREKEMDKYFHSKANCEATQELGILGEKTAEVLSDAKEYYDQYTYVHTHRVTVEEAIADSEKDQVANILGRERGRNNPYCPCSELMKDRLPDYKK